GHGNSRRGNRLSLYRIANGTNGRGGAGAPGWRGPRHRSTSRKESEMKALLIPCAAAVLLSAVNASAQELGPAVLESASDLRIQEEVQSRLNGDHHLDHSLLVASVHDGHVSITGTLK